MTETQKLAIATSWYRDKVFWTIIGISAIILSPMLIEPLSFDSAINQTLGIDMLSLGRVPYLQIFDHGFPGSLYLSCIELLIFGPSDLGLRIFDLILQLAFAGFLYRFLLTWLPSRTAALSSILYVLFYVSAGSGVYEQRDVYVAMSLFVAASLIFRGNSFWRISEAGLLLGFSILLRPTSLLFLALYVLFLLVNTNLRPISKNILRSFVLTVFGLLPMAIFFLYITQFSHGIESFYSAAIRFNIDIYAHLKTTSQPLWEFLRSGFVIAFAVVAVFSSRAQIIRCALSHKEKLLYVACILSSLLIVIIQGKYFRNHISPFFILLVPLAAVGITSLTDRVNGEVRRHYAILGCLVICSLIRFKPTSSLAFGLALLTHHDPFQAAYQVQYDDTLFGAKQEFAIQNYFQKKGNRSGLIEICSLDPLLRLHLHRTYATGYASLHTLAATVRYDSNNTPTYMDYQISGQYDYVDSLRLAQPRFIIIARQMKFWEVKDFNAFLHYLPGFDSLLAASYKRDTTFGGYEVYRQKGL